MNACTCVGQPDGFTYDPETGLWVHAACRKPTRACLEGLQRRQNVIGNE